MLAAEILTEIAEGPISDWGDEAFFEEEDDSEDVQGGGNTGDENDQKGVVDLTGVTVSSRPTTTTKSIGSSLRSDGKRMRIKPPRPAMYSFGSVGVRRDPIVDSIIESRKVSIIENPYTRLAQGTAQAPRLSQLANQYDTRPSTAEGGEEEAEEEEEEESKDRKLSSRNARSVQIAATSELDNEGWDDGLTGEPEKEKIPATDKSCAQLYEETCKRLNICACSMVVRSLNTTEINLRNYGLGPRGCAALAVGLVRNTTVLSLNLSQNNIGSHGMSHIYHVLVENTYIEEYDLSFNNLGTKGIIKLAAAIPQCMQVKTLSIAGNGLNASDIQILLTKFEDHSNIKTLNISHNQLEEDGGIFVAKWLSDNNTLLTLDMSWCSIRLTGAKALAKSIGDNNRLLALNLFHNSFTNETIDLIANSLSRNMVLCELNLRENQFISRYDATVKETPSILITGKDCQLYKMLVAAATNQTLKIFHLGQNHIDARCLMIMLEALSKVDQITLEELDLTGLTISENQISKVNSLFVNHTKLTCFVGPVRQTIESFANNLLHLINRYCDDNEVSLSDLFNPQDDTTTSVSTVTYEQFLQGLRRAKIPFPIALINDIMKYIGRENEEEELIVLRSLILD